MAELMHQGPVDGAGPESRDDVGITNFGELVAFSGEPSNVILEGLTRLLPTTFQVPGVAQLHVRAMKVASEGLLQVLLAINHVSGQVVEPGPGCVG
jgi:hypothetical protein